MLIIDTIIVLLLTVSLIVSFIISKFNAKRTILLNLVIYILFFFIGSIFIYLYKGKDYLLSLIIDFIYSYLIITVVSILILLALTLSDRQNKKK